MLVLFKPLVLTAQDTALSFSCAAFPRTLSESDLIRRFGAENVASGQVSGLDDGPVSGSVVYARRPSAKVEVAWRDSVAKSGAAFVIVKPGAIRWRVATDVAVGTDLRTLERLNWRPFRLEGFRAELPGLVRGWNGGHLETLLAANCPLSIHLYLRKGTDDPGAIRPVTTGTFSSAHPTMQMLNPEVVALLISYAW